MSDEDKKMLEKLRFNAGTGADLSPGDPVAAWAAKKIDELESKITQLKKDVIESRATYSW